MYCIVANVVRNPVDLLIIEFYIMCSPTFKCSLESLARLHNLSYNVLVYLFRRKTWTISLNLSIYLCIILLFILIISLSIPHNNYWNDERHWFTSNALQTRHISAYHKIILYLRLRCTA